MGSDILIPENIIHRFSINFHAKYAASLLFAVEVDNFMPHMNGAKAYFMKMEQHFD